MSPKRIAIIGGILVTVIVIIIIATNVSKPKLAETSTHGKLETSTVEVAKRHCHYRCEDDLQTAMRSSNYTK